RKGKWAGFPIRPALAGLEIRPTFPVPWAYFGGHKRVSLSEARGPSAPQERKTGPGFPTGARLSFVGRFAGASLTGRRGQRAGGAPRPAGAGRPPPSRCRPAARPRRPPRTRGPRRPRRPV